MSTESKTLAIGLPCDTVMALLSSAERASKLALSMHELLTQKGETALARLAWVTHLEASGSAETIGESIGLEVDA